MKNDEDSQLKRLQIKCIAQEAMAMVKWLNLSENESFSIGACAGWNLVQRQAFFFHGFILLAPILRETVGVSR